ncbi:TetR family transcriptional regulator [Microbacterium sp. AG790]|uniref:TetR/AcrR family transcriptional regulator n=1 Tax=Microbacterium sp. AG790 TaxID=2183995 RepID=UPI000F19504D|nr:TetR/AcrR family transcriptional regulator [Microbacterium sp. AG790]RKS90173.1 TetR family transcriptional regulator [Microbacterium sp. AG790]
MSEMPPAHERDGRFARGDARKERILRAAIRQFGRKGYDCARVADIAREAGVTDAGVLHHFGSKRDLFLAATTYREEVVWSVLASRPVSVRALFDGAIEIVRRSADDPDLLAFRAMLVGAYRAEGNPVAGRDGTTLSAALEWLTPVVRESIDDGEIDESVDPEQLILELLALTEGIRNHWAALPDRIDYVHVATQAINSLYERARSRREPSS